MLRQIGLTTHESSVYLSILNQPRQTAQSIARATGITRTNTYRVLDILVQQGLIEADTSPVKRFSITNPRALQELIQKKQASLRQTATSLSSAMPAFRAQYSLSLDRPGIVHMTGDDGLERLLLDMVNAQTEVLLIAGDEPKDKTIRHTFRELIMRRKDNHVPTRALFHDGTHHDHIVDKFHARGFDVRFLDSPPFPSEVVLYEDNIVFCVYDPSILITVITNSTHAATMRMVFAQLWQSAHS